MRLAPTVLSSLDVQRLGDDMLRVRNGSLRGVLECSAVPTPDLRCALAVLVATRHGGQVVLQTRRQVAFDGAAPTTRLRASYDRLLAVHQLRRGLLDRLLVVVPWDVEEGGDGTFTVQTRLADLCQVLAKVGLEPVRLRGTGLDALIGWASVEESQRRVRVDGRFGRTLTLTASPEHALRARLDSLDMERDLSLHLRRRGREGLELSAYLTVYTESPGTLDGAAADAEKILSSVGTEPRHPHFQAQAALVSTLPICLDQLSTGYRVPERLFHSAAVLNTGPRATRGQLLHGVHPDSRRPLLIDRFGLPNPNCVIAGTEAHGRSLAVALEVMRARMLGREVHVVDPGGEHVGVVRALGGDDTAPGTSGEAPFDPFPVRSGTGSLTDRIRTLTALVDVTCGGLRPGPRAAVADAISFCYAVNGHVERDAVYDLKPPGIADVRAALVRRALRAEDGHRPELERVVAQIARYVDGDLRGLLGPERALSAGVPLTVHSLVRVPDADRAVAMVLSLDRLIRLGAGARPGLTVIAGADTLLRYGAACDLLSRFMLSAAERRVAVTLVLEDLDAALRGPLRDALVGSGMKVLLRHAPEAAARVTDLLRLTPAERDFLTRAGNTEGLVVAEGRRRPFRAVTSNEELRLMTNGGICQ
jgi:hypothetical protein